MSDPYGSGDPYMSGDDFPPYGSGSGGDYFPGYTCSTMFDFIECQYGFMPGDTKCEGCYEDECCKEAPPTKEPTKEPTPEPTMMPTAPAPKIDMSCVKENMAYKPLD